MAKKGTKDVIGVDSVPPFLPLIIEDWCGDDRVQDMSMSERGIYISFLVEQWRSKDCPAAPYKLANVIGAGVLRYETAKGWLERWASKLNLHYEVRYCAKHASAAGTRVQQGEYTATTRLLQKQNILTTDGKTACGDCVLRLYHPKLRNLRNRVKNDGSDAPNLTEPNSTEGNETERTSGSEVRTDFVPEFDPVFEQDEVPAPESERSPEPEPNTSPVSESSPAHAQVQVPVPPSAEGSPASAPPKRVLTDAEKCAVHLFNLLDRPKRFQTNQTLRHWSKLMQQMLAETGMEYSEFVAYLKWAVTENIDQSSRTRSSAEWIPVAKDPCQTLCDKTTGNNPWLVELWKVKKKLANVTAKTVNQPQQQEEGKRITDDLLTRFNKK